MAVFIHNVADTISTLTTDVHTIFVRESGASSFEVVVKSGNMELVFERLSSQADAIAAKNALIEQI